MSFGEDGFTRNCPYCGELLSRPYWQHIQANHPDEYTAKKTWIQLYKDYSGMGMDKAICLMVIGELFNAEPDEIESFLKGEGVIE